MLLEQAIYLQATRQLEMHHKVTCNQDLVYWDRSRSCIMGNGDAIIYGKTSDDSPAEFHVYNAQGQKIKIFKPFCEHEHDVYLLANLIGGIEYLMVSCADCHKIRLYNMDTVTITEAWHDPRCKPGPMCHGPQDRVCAVDIVKGRPVIILDSTSILFYLKYTVHTQMEGHHSISCVPTADLLLITDHSPGIIRAVSFFTDKLIWQVTGEVDGLPCDPHGLVYSSQHDMVFVCDGLNRRILILEPMSGECVQTIDLSQHVTVAWQPHLYEDQLILRHSGTDYKPKLSYFTVSLNSLTVA